MSRISQNQALKLVGKQVYALRKDGTTVRGKLVRVSGNRIMLEQPEGKKVSTKAFLAFGAAPFGFAPFGFGGFAPFGFGPFGFGRFWW